MIIDEKMLTKLHAEAKESPRLRKNLDLRNDAEENSQRMLNALEVGTVIPIHRHQDTAETLILLDGDIDEVYFDDNGKETQRFHICKACGCYGIQVPKGTWHRVEVNKPSVIIEVKAGKYKPVAKEDLIEND